MLQVAGREQPVKWNTLLCDLLHRFGLTPTPAVQSSLDALTLYAASSHDISNNTVSGVQAVKTYAAILLSLHAATSSWPAEIASSLMLPPVRIGGDEISISGPAMEVFVVLYNSAVSSFNAGTAIMARIWTEQCRNTTRGSRPSSVVNTDGKAAYKCFQVATELATCAEQALAMEADRLLSPPDVYLLRHHFDFRSIREFAELCVAITKYVYSTSFGALSNKHDALAKLAHQAATVVLPAALPSEIIRLLPTLLLAAYHRHRAEHYSKASKVPDMSLVLAHINYARRLVEDVEQECKNANCKKSQSGRWGLLAQLSVGLIGGGKWSKDDDHSDDNNSKEQPFKSLVKLLEKSCLVSIFPLVSNLICEISSLYEKYHHENNVIYHTRPAPEKDIIADAPEVEQLGFSVNPPTQYIPLANQLSVDVTKFSELPTAEEVGRALRLRDVSRVLWDTVKRHLDIVQELIQNMKEKLLLPMNVELELGRVESLLRRKRGIAPTIDELLDEAFNAVTFAWQQHEAVSDELYRAKCEYIGEYVANFRSTASLKERERVLREKLRKLRATLAEELPHRCEAALRQTLLLPEELKLRTCITRTEAAAFEAKKTLALSSVSTDELTDCVTELKNVRETAEAALRRISPLCAESRWERVARVFSGVAAFITEAEDFVAAAETETRLMDDQKSRIVVTPLSRLSGVHFCGGELEQKQRRRQKVCAKKTQQHESDVESSRSSTAEEEDNRNAENKGKRVSRKAKKASELSDSEELIPPKAIVSASLLQRIKDKEQEAEAESKNSTNKRRRR